MYKIIDPKGRVTIPREMRDEFGIQPDTIVSFRKCGNCLVIRPEKVCGRCNETPCGKAAGSG